jgi:YD repeat-containing protein
MSKISFKKIKIHCDYKVLILVIASLILIQGTVFPIKRSDAVRFGLKGNVKSFSASTYKASIVSLKLKKGALLYKMVCFFDENENLTKYIVKEKDSAEIVTTSHYDKYGQRIEHNDTKGGYKKFQYDSNGNPINYSTYVIMKDSSIVSFPDFCNFRYNKDNRIEYLETLEQRKYYKYDKDTATITTFKSEMNIFDSDHKIKQKERVVYNSNNDEISIKLSIPADSASEFKLLSETTINYVFDKEGNWITRTIVTYNHSLKKNEYLIEERKIRYY